MTTKSLLDWLAENNHGGFLVEERRLKRAKDITFQQAKRSLRGGPLDYSTKDTVHSYAVEWKVIVSSQPGIAKVTPTCLCADWLQSGGWTEKRLCKHLLSLAIRTDIPSAIQSLKPEAQVAQEQSGSAAAPQVIQTPAAGQPSFGELIAKAIDHAIGAIADQVKEILEEGYVPLLVGPTGCGKTSAIRRVASMMSCRLVEHSGSDSYTDSDLVGVMMPSGQRMPGPVAQALGHAREMVEPVLLFLDEFTRYHMRAQESLMRLLLPIDPEVVQSLGINYKDAIRATSAPFWGDEWAPASLVNIALACNPWGTPLDPALVRRTVPVTVGFTDQIASLFNLKVATAIRLSWSGTQDGTLPLPLEYGELVRASSPDDDHILARYRQRLTVLDPAASTAFDALLKGAGV